VFVDLGIALVFRSGHTSDRTKTLGDSSRSAGLWDTIYCWPMVPQSRSIERNSRLRMVVRLVSLSNGTLYLKTLFLVPN